MTRDDPELGEVRLCPRCGEWWPDDDEFYAPGLDVCRACYSEATRTVREHRRRVMADAARRYRLRRRGVLTPETDLRHRRMSA
jgi:hypothetical protein